MEQHESENVFRKYAFEELLRLVATGCGAVGVAFMLEDQEYARAVRDGTTGNEFLNDLVASHITAGARKSWFTTIFAPLIAKATQEYKSLGTYQHCELAFKLSDFGMSRFGQDKMLSINVALFQGVQIKPRHFHDKYNWQWLACDARQMRAMLWHAFTTQQEKFSDKQMNRTVTNPGPERKNTWFCVYHIMRSLRYLPAADLHLQRANVLTIDELYTLLQHCAQTTLAPVDTSVLVAPHVLEQMYGLENTAAHVYNRRTTEPEKRSPQKKRPKKVPNSRKVK